MPIDVHAEVIDNVQLSSDYNVVSFAAPGIAALAAPGQFVMVKPSNGLDPLLRRPFSIFEILRDAAGTIRGLSILNKRVGVGTSLLFNARPHDRLSVLGPLGVPFEAVNPPAHAMMVAGGVGLAPFATLADALAARGTRTTLFYGARSAADLHYADAFARRRIAVVLTTEDGTRGERGRVTAPLGRALAALAPDAPVTIYACGPTPMMRAVAEIGAAAARPVFVSLEPAMGCGLGGCYSCVVKVRRSGSAGHFVRSCIDGPVFQADTLVWDAMPAGAH